MAFKEFSNMNHYLASKKEDVTIRVSGYAFIPMQVIERFTKENANYVIFFLDDENRKLGIKFATEINSQTRGAMKVLEEKSGRAFSINPVLNYFSISKPRSKIKLVPTKQDDMMILDLNDLIEDK